MYSANGTSTGPVLAVTLTNNFLPCIDLKNASVHSYVPHLVIYNNNIFSVLAFGPDGS